MAIKQVNRIYSDFDLSFAANPVTGDVAKKYDVNAVKQSLKTLVLTRFYERPFQPKLGSPIYALLFENIDVITANRLQLELEILINKYEPRVRAQDIEVVPEYDTNTFSVNITFYVYGIEGPFNFSTILRRSR
jgi:phage baseplate assembly protein W